MATEETTGTDTSTELTTQQTQVTQSAPSTQTQQASTPDAQASAWTPDYTYEFDGKKREIDPFFRGLIKDDDSLKKVRDYIQRADAASKYREKIGTYESEWKPIVDRVNKLQYHYGKEDHDRVFQELGYTDDMLFKIVKAKLDRAQLPQEQQEAIEAKKMMELEKERIMEENMMYREQASQELARVTDIELDMELAKPEYSSLKSAYDKAYGEGAFKSLVIDRGAYMVAQQGTHVRPSQLLSLVSREFSPFLGATQEQATMAPQQIATTGKRVIPNVGKGSGSPTRQAIRSLDDLKKRAKQLD